MSIQTIPPQPSEQLDPYQSDLITNATMEAEAVVAYEDVMMTVEELKDADPLDKFLPPPTKDQCSDELQVSSSLEGPQGWLLLKASTLHLIIFSDLLENLIWKFKNTDLEIGPMIFFLSFGHSST